MQRTILSAVVLLVLLLLLLVDPGLRAEEAWMFEPDFRPGRPSDLLHEGPPPLLRGQLDAFVDLLEAGFDLALRPSEAQRLRDALETEYAVLDPSARETFAALVVPCSALRAQGRAGDTTAMHAGLRAFRHALDRRLVAQPALRSNALIAGVLERRQAVAWPGTPPIGGSAADAWLDLSGFVVSLARNEAVTPTPGQRESVLRELGAAFHPHTVALRGRLQTVQRPWLRLQAAWDAADLERRLALRWRAVDLLARAVPAGERIEVGGGGDLVAYARAAAALARTQSGYEAWANLSRHPEAVLDMLAGWLPVHEGLPDNPLLYRAP